MSRIKLFTHCDLDGIGCAFLAYLAFGYENVDVEYCGYNNVDEKVGEFLQDGLDKNYDRIFITDISIREDTVNLLAPNVHNIKWRLFDHHATALWLNKYGWCEVRVDDNQRNVKASGTSIFFDYLASCDFFKNYDGCRLMNIIRFVEIVRDYDTWRWKELGEEGVICKQVNDLFHIYGREKFIDWCISKILWSGPKFPVFEEVDELLLSNKQNEIDIYVAAKEKQLQIATDQFGKMFGWVFAERYFSELGNRLCELHPEVAYVAMIDISTGAVSFRSIREDIDLGGEIAHSLGGGGHKKAAGSRFDAVKIGKYVSWKVLNMKPTWSDIIPQYMGEPFENKED